jgi:hypothetical protein
METTTHMLGVPPKSSGGANQSLCHVAVNENAWRRRPF